MDDKTILVRKPNGRTICMADTPRIREALRNFGYEETADGIWELF